MKYFTLRNVIVVTSYLLVIALMVWASQYDPRGAGFVLGMLVAVPFILLIIKYVKF